MQHVIIILYINQGPLKEVVQQGLTLFLSKAGGPGPWKSFILLIQGRLWFQFGSKRPYETVSEEVKTDKPSSTFVKG